jgi:hypothetical protein
MVQDGLMGFWMRSLSIWNKGLCRLPLSVRVEVEPIEEFLIAGERSARASGSVFIREAQNIHACAYTGREVLPVGKSRSSPSGIVTIKTSMRGYLTGAIL